MINSCGLSCVVDCDGALVVLLLVRITPQFYLILK